MINQKEYEILKDLDDRLGWLARDGYGDLVAYEKKPEKSTSFWFDDGRMVNLGVIFDDGRLFQFIQWEDEEPYRISDLIKGYENKEHTFRLGNFEVSDFVDNSSGKSYTVFSLVVGEDEEMKKDKEWLKEKIKEELKGWEAIDSRVGESVIEDVLYCVDQLDEPEVLSEEWIENKKWQAYDPDARTLYWAVTETDLENLLVPKQDGPVVPAWFDEWWEDVSQGEGNLFHNINQFHDKLYSSGTREMYNYINAPDNKKKLLDIIVNELEYVVESEQRYYAKIKGHELLSDREDSYWNVDREELYIDNIWHDYSGYKTTKLTKDEWENLGINEDNADFVKVEEVE